MYSIYWWLSHSWNSFYQAQASASLSGFVSLKIYLCTSQPQIVFKLREKERNLTIDAWYLFPARLPDRSFMNQYVEKDPCGKGFRCSLCEQQGQTFKNKGSYHIINHIESKHFPNTFVYNCDNCDKIMPTAKAQSRHKEKCGKAFVPLIWDWYPVLFLCYTSKNKISSF